MQRRCKYTWWVTTGRIIKSTRVRTTRTPWCTLIKANPSAFVVVSAAPCVSIRISTSSRASVCNVDFVIHQAAAAATPAPQPLHLLLYMKLSAWQLLREYVLCFNPRYAPPLNHHPPAYTGVLKSTKLHRRRRLSAK